MGRFSPAHLPADLGGPSCPRSYSDRRIAIGISVIETEPAATAPAVRCDLAGSVEGSIAERGRPAAGVTSTPASTTWPPSVPDRADCACRGGVSPEELSRLSVARLNGGDIEALSPCTSRMRSWPCPTAGWRAGSHIKRTGRGYGLSTSHFRQAQLEGCQLAEMTLPAGRASPRATSIRPARARPTSGRPPAAEVRTPR
jgi:hypothetical protein